jgi:phospholipid/cholesterol/gamma-HCH transport system substrate-binding protein
MNISKEVKIGLLGAAAIVMFVVGYNYLKGTGVFSTTKIIRSEYDNVQGLTPSSYVQIQGFNVGAVKKISLSKDHPGKILVEMTIDEDIAIPIDSKVKIVSLDLLGGKAVSVVLGQSATMAKNNQMMAGEIELGTIEALGSSVTPAIDNANKILLTLDTTVHSINNVLDVNTQNNLKQSIAQLNSTMTELHQFSNELNAQRQKITSTLNNLNSFSTNLNTNNARINKIITNADLTTNNLSKINFEATVNELKSTLQALNNTISKMNNGNGTLALLMNDDKLYKNLKNTLSTANNLLYDINARPSRYINVNIFGKKQKNECPPQPAPNAND